MKIRLPWSSHCRFAHEPVFHYNKMLASANEERFSLHYNGKLVARVYWDEISDISLVPMSNKYIVSLKLDNGSSLDLVFSRRSWLGLHAPDVAVDVGHELRTIKYQLQYA